MNRFILAAALLLPIVGWASDQDGYFRPYFMTNKDADYATCQGFVTATDLARQGHYSSINQFNQWLDGFLTAYDMYTPDTFDIAFGKDLESLDVMVEKFCRQHPHTFFNKAAESLTFDLYTTRAKTAPKSR